MNAGSVARDGEIGARRAATGSAREGAARAGLTARGVIYVLVGVLALRIAFGDSGGRQADRGGALQEIATKPFGAALLWALGAGLVGMALWRLSEASFGAAGQDGGKAGKRLMAAGRCVFYGFVAYSVLAFAAARAAAVRATGSPRTSRPRRWACPVASGSSVPPGRVWSSRASGSPYGP